jgi:hypothetical protein
LKSTSGKKTAASKPAKAGILRTAAIHFVIGHAIGMGIPLDDRVPAKEHGTEERGADLTHASADAFDGSAPVNDQGFGKAVFED